MHRRAAARNIGIPLLLTLLAFAVLTALGGTLVGAASATPSAAAARQAQPSPSATTGLPERAVQPTPTTHPNSNPDQLPLRSAQTLVSLHVQPTEPAKAAVAAGEPQGYTATVHARIGPDPWSIDVTRWTGFSVDGDRKKCSRPKGNVSCTATTKGLHTVLGILPPNTLPLVPFQLRGTAELRVVPGSLTGIKLQPAEATVKVGAPQPYTVTGIDRYGNERDGDLTATTDFAISPSDSSSCTKDAATASCMATRPGDYTVIGKLTGTQITRQALLHVAPGDLAKLVLNPNPARIVAGTPQPYHAEGFDAYGNSLGDYTAPTDFSISPPDSGSCTKAGAAASCTATKMGVYQVTGSVELGSRQVTGQAVLHVRPGELAKLVLNPNPAKTAAGRQQRYHAEGYDAYDNPLGDYTEQTQFSINRPGSCTRTGTAASCTATTTGTYAVTGTVDLGSRQVTGEATLQVGPGTLKRLELRPRKVAIPAGVPQPYQVWGFDAYNNPLGELTARTGFSIDPTESCTIVGAEVSCTIARSYTVTGRLDGTGLQATADLLVQPGPLAGIQLQPDTAKVQAGTPQPYTVTGIDQYGNKHPGDLTATTDFAISPSGSCTKNGATATCTATKIGDYTVTGALAGTGFRATAKLLVVPGELAGIRLAPDTAQIQVGGQQPYTVKGVDQYGNERADDLAGRATLSIDPPGSCAKDSCTAPTPGAYTITGTLNGTSFADTAELLVVASRQQPSIATVTPAFTPPARAVEVRGNTGSCSHVGTLTFHGAPKEASVKVTGDEHGDFVAGFTVPAGTFPNAYKLALTVDCTSQLQRAEGGLTVINLAPVAVDDAATTTQDTPVAIAVTGNDRNPDPDTGYQLVVVEHGSPANGTIQVQPDGVIIYTPSAGFLGRDQFQYGLCDNVLNAAGTADCGIATVTVTVNPATSTTVPTGPAGGGGGGPVGGGPSGGGSSSGGPPTTTGPCALSAGDLRQHLQVTPIKGPGGTKLRITATVDPKLATCSLRLLLGGNPLGHDLSVGSDGGIATQVPVPPDAIPGRSVLRLATTSGQVLDQASFEILPTLLRRWWERNPYRLLLGVSALLGGALARATLRRLRRLLQEHDQDQQEQARVPGLRADPHTRPPEMTVAPDLDDRPTRAVRLQPHGDAGALTLQEVPR
jgi:hypothetical protein